jgi:hypothetical protein
VAAVILNKKNSLSAKEVVMASVLAYKTRRTALQSCSYEQKLATNVAGGAEHGAAETDEILRTLSCVAIDA